MGGGRLCLGGDGSGGSVVVHMSTTTIQKESLAKHKLTKSVFHKEDRLYDACVTFGVYLLQTSKTSGFSESH